MNLSTFFQNIFHKTDKNHLATIYCSFLFDIHTKALDSQETERSVKPTRGEDRAVVGVFSKRS